MSRKGAPFYCTYEKCTSYFSRSDRLEHHLRTHTGERPFTCGYPECGKTFTSSQHLKRHESTHESSFNCTIEGCSETFKRKDALKRHIDNFHQKKNPKQYKCTECDKQFNKHNWLQSHMYKHTGTFPYICQNAGCGKGFLLPSKLKRHMKIHEGYMCKIPGCEATFLKWSLYTAHLKLFHPTVHQCNICDRKFTHLGNMKDHIKMHKEPLSREVFPCEVPNCPRYYFAEKNLNWHVKTYHEARLYACDKEHCHKAFKTKDALDQHSLRHTRRKPRKKKKPKPSFSAVLSGCEDPRKFIRKMPRKRSASESSDEFTTDDEIVYQDTSSDENTNRNSASEMTYSSEETTCDNPTPSQSTDSQFDEAQPGTAEPNRETIFEQPLPEYGHLCANEGPPTKVFLVSKDNHKTKKNFKPPNKRRKLEMGDESIRKDSVNDHIDSRDDHIDARDDHIYVTDDHINSGDDHMESFQEANDSGNEENANSSEYETIKVSVFGNAFVWEKSYSGSDEVSSCLSEAEEFLNCEDVFLKRER